MVKSFRTLPRLHLHQHNFSGKRSTIYLPNSVHIVTFHWTFLALHFFWLQTTALLTGYYHMTNNEAAEVIAFSFHYAGYTISHLSIACILAFYGRRLVLLTQKSLAMVGTK